MSQGATAKLIRVFKHYVNWGISIEGEIEGSKMEVIIN